MKKKFNLNQLALPFDTLGQRSFGQGRTRTISYEDRSKAFWFLAGLCAFSLVAYIYAVNATARNVSMRASLERESTELSAELAKLEFQYIAERSAVTLELAKQYGFQEVKEPLYVARGGAEHSLSFNTQKP